MLTADSSDSIHPGNVPGTEILPGGIPEHLKHGKRRVMKNHWDGFS